VKQRRAETNRGRKLSPAHIEDIRRAKLAMTAETRAKISAARKASATHGQIFTPEHDEIIRTHPPGEAAKLTGRSMESIYSRRKVMGIAERRGGK